MAFRRCQKDREVVAFCQSCYHKINISRGFNSCSVELVLHFLPVGRKLASFQLLHEPCGETGLMGQERLHKRDPIEGPADSLFQAAAGPLQDQVADRQDFPPALFGTPLVTGAGAGQSNGLSLPAEGV